MVLAAFITDACDDGALDTADNVSAVVELFDHLDDVFDVVFRGMRFHYDDHAGNLLTNHGWRLCSNPSACDCGKFVRIVRGAPTS